MSRADWSKFKTRKRPAGEPRKVEPVRILTTAEKAALLADRPDLQPSGSRARGVDQRDVTRISRRNTP